AAETPAVLQSTSGLHVRGLRWRDVLTGETTAAEARAVLERLAGLCPARPIAAASETAATVSAEIAAAACEIPAVADLARPTHVAAPIDAGRTRTAPFVVTPAAVQPEPIRPAIAAVIDRAAIPKPAVIDRLVPQLVQAVIRRVAPRRSVIVAGIGIRLRIGVRIGIPLIVIGIGVTRAGIRIGIGIGSIAAVIGIASTVIPACRLGCC